MLDGELNYWAHTSRFDQAIAGSARYQDTSWESTSRNVSAIAGVRLSLK